MDYRLNVLQHQPHRNLLKQSTHKIHYYYCCCSHHIVWLADVAAADSSPCESDTAAIISSSSSGPQKLNHCRSTGPQCTSTSTTIDSKSAANWNHCPCHPIQFHHHLRHHYYYSHHGPSLLSGSYPVHLALPSPPDP